VVLGSERLVLAVAAAVAAVVALAFGRILRGFLPSTVPATAVFETPSSGMTAMAAAATEATDGRSESPLDGRPDGPIVISMGIFSCSSAIQL
jgi:hypothetical protein